MKHFAENVMELDPKFSVWGIVQVTIRLSYLQPSGTRFHHIFADHPSVVDSLGLGCNPISSHRPTDTSENFC